MRDFDLRSATSDDEQFLWEMLYLASHSYEEEGVSLRQIRENPDLIGYITGWLAGPMPGVIAEVAGEPVGAAWLRKLGEADRAVPVFVDEATPELAIAVSTGVQGMGVGSAMLRRLIRDARGSVPAMVLSARSDNRAIGLYQRHGFRIVDQIENRVGTRSVKMMLTFADEASDRPV